MFDRFLDAFGLRSPRARHIEETVVLADTLAADHNARLPSYMRNNVRLMSPLWSAPLYTQLATAPESPLSAREWRRASNRVGHLLMERILGHPVGPGDETFGMDTAIAAFVLNTCRLWLSYFGPTPDRARFENAESLYEEMLALFRDENLGLAETLSLDDEPFEEEEPFDEFGEEAEYEDPDSASDEPERTELEELCYALAQSFASSAQARS